MDTVKPDELVDALVNAFAEYSEEFKETLDEKLTQIGKEAVKEVKKLSPVYTGTVRNLKNGPKTYMKKTPEKYKKGWRYSVIKNRGAIRVIVHNKHYQITHLLEKPHLNRDGTTFSKAMPHISIANKHAEEKVDKLLEVL